MDTVAIEVKVEHFKSQILFILEKWLIENPSLSNLRDEINLEHSELIHSLDQMNDIKDMRAEGKDIFEKEDVDELNPDDNRLHERYYLNRIGEIPHFEIGFDTSTEEITVQRTIVAAMIYFDPVIGHLVEHSAYSDSWYDSAFEETVDATWGEDAEVVRLKLKETEDE